MSISKPLEDILDSIQSKIKKLGKGSGIDESIASEMVYNYGKDLGIIGARIWEVRKNYIVLREQKGGRKKIRPGFKVDINYQPVQELLNQGFTLTNSHHPGYDQKIESSIGSENSLALLISPKTIMAIEVDDIRKARPALQLMRIALDASIKKKEVEEINNLARRIERSLLPVEKDISALKPNYEASWYVKPAQVVRGDYLRFKPMDDGSTAIAVGDARGKGITASIVAQSTHIALEALTAQDLRAARVMKTINNTLYKTEITSEYMTLFYATLTPNGAISYVRAGHPPPFLVHKDYTEILDEGGILLGQIENAKYNHGVAKIRPGDVLFVYTDGLYEIKNKKGKELGINGLEEIVKKYRELPAKEIKNNVLNDVRDYMLGKKFLDDVTFAVVKKIK